MATVLAAAALLIGRGNAAAQSYYEYKFVFNGTAYQTNAAGDIVGTPITDQTLLQSRAVLGGITDLSTIAIVYHLNGGSLGDTIDIISTNGATLTTEFGLYFGSAASLGRTAVTNLTQTEQRRLDYVYTFNGSQYTDSNPDSVGAAITTKRFLVDSAGNTNMFIEGQISWDVQPQGTNGPILCIGNFTLGRPMF